MSFFLSSGSKGSLPALLCRRDHGFDEYPEEGGVVTMVAEGIVALSFEYYAQAQWFPEWRATEPLPPEAVRVTLVAACAPRAGARRAAETTVLSSVVAIHANAAEGGQNRGEGGTPNQGGSPSPGGPPR